MTYVPLPGTTAATGGATLVLPSEESAYVKAVSDAAEQLYGAVPNLYDPTQDRNYSAGRVGYRDHSVPGQPDYDPRYDKRTKVGAEVDKKATFVLQFIDWLNKLRDHKQEWDDHVSAVWGSVLMPLPNVVASLTAVEEARVKSASLTTAQYEKELGQWQGRLIGDAIVEAGDAPDLNNVAESRPKSITETILTSTPTAPSVEGSAAKAAVSYLLPVAIVGAGALAVYLYVTSKGARMALS